MDGSVLLLCGAFEERERALFAREFDKVIEVGTAGDCPGLIERHRPAMAMVGPEITADEAVGILRSLAAGAVRCPVVVVTREADIELDRRLGSEGAFDCLRRPVMPISMKRVMERLKAAREQGRDFERFLCPCCPSGVPIVGRSPGMIAAMETIKRIAESPCNPVLLLGETGTGKELAARAVHAWRCGDPEKFIAVNCATLNANLLESELFGHVKGSFTGADRDKAGLLEAAGGGSILLDEISEMPLELQAKLLRFLQERKFRKVGGTADIRSTATVMATSNLALAEQARLGRFRKDLYFRLAVFPVELPPLRSPRRRDDIPMLAEYFVRVSEMALRGSIRGVSREALGRLAAHNWPGNVRELHNVMERAMILERTDVITAASIVIDGLAEPAGEDVPVQPGAEFSLETAEKEFISRALQVAGWHRTRAADMLGITRATLHAKIKRYDIRMPAGTAQSPMPAASNGASD